MGDVIPFPIDKNDQLNIQTEELTDKSTTLEQDSARAVRLAEALRSDVVIAINFGSTEPDYDSPA